MNGKLKMENGKLFIPISSSLQKPFSHPELVSEPVLNLFQESNQPYYTG